jgi:membrane-associated phospholipid phosphatase
VQRRPASRRDAGRPGRPENALAFRGGDFANRPALIAAAAVAVALAAFVPHAVEAWQKDVSSWDRNVSEAIHAYENRDTVLNRHFDVLALVLHPGVQILAALVALGAAVALSRHGLRRRGAMLLIGVVGATLLGPVLKEVFDRPPVDPGGSATSADVKSGDAFPSGHALRSMAVAASLAVAAWPTRFRWPVVVIGVVAVGLIGLAVVYHEWHWASDVIGGWAVAVAWIGCVWLALHPRATQTLQRRVGAMQRRPEALSGR